MPSSASANLIPFETFDQYERVILYPAGTGVVYFTEFLREKHPGWLNKIVGLGDRDVNKIGRAQCGFQVHAPEKLGTLKPDLVVVCSNNMQALEPYLRERLSESVHIVGYDNVQEYYDFEAEGSALAQLAEQSELDLSEIEELSGWFLSMPLGQSRYTASTKGVYTYRMLKSLQLPNDMTGQSVLDLGGSDGFHSFECAARGASEVTTVEWFEWTTAQGLARFEAARDMYGLSVQPVHADVENMDYESLGTFDTVLCLGLYYHMKNPLALINNLATVTKQTLILSGRAAAMPVINPQAIENVHRPERLGSYLVMSNTYPKWLANVQCLSDLLKLAGFASVEVLQDLCPQGSQISSVVLRANK